MATTGAHIWPTATRVWSMTSIQPSCVRIWNMDIKAWRETITFGESVWRIARPLDCINSFVIHELLTLFNHMGALLHTWRNSEPIVYTDSGSENLILVPNNSQGTSGCSLPEICFLKPGPTNGHHMLEDVADSKTFSIECPVSHVRHVL